MDENLIGLIENLQKACDSKDWEQLELINVQIKQNLNEMLLMSISLEQKQKLALELKAIQKVYELVIDGSQKNQIEIAAELKKLSKDRNAANSYLGVSQI